MRRFLLILAILWGGVFLIGCQAESPTTEPPTILYGQDTCDSCKMIISEENLAAAYWTTAGDAHRFDDIGGMLAYYQESGDEVASWWVHDFHNGEWLNAEEAYFVMSSHITTPMDFGIIALANEQSATALLYEDDEGMMMNFTDMIKSDSVTEHNHE